MFFLILFVLFFVLDAVWAVWADGRLKRLPNPRPWRVASAAFVALCAGVLMWWVLGRRMGWSRPPAGLMSLAMIWHLVVLPMAVIAAMGWSGLRGVAWGVKRLTDSTPTDPSPNPGSEAAPAEAALSRRQFLSAVAAAAPIVLTFSATGVGHHQLNHFRVRRFTVPIASLPPALEGLTIAHVSDTHVGRFTHGRVLDKIVEATNTLADGRPCDLVLFTGDLINDSNSDLDPAIDMARRFAARHGSYFVEGNHDLFDGPAVFRRTVREGGLNLLTNESALFEIRGQRVQVLGLQWGPPRRLLYTDTERRRYRGGDEALGASLAEVLPQLDSGAFPILLAHHPHALDHAAAAGIPLTLSGHTHGGQLMLTDHIGPGPLMYRYWSGLYRTANGAAGVISNGVGNWFPLRINAPAEIIQLTLTRA